MRQVVKPVGATSVEVAEVPIPEPGAGQVRIKAMRSLISRGSETGRLTIGPDDDRYSREEAAGRPKELGYSLAGVVDALGAGVSGHWLGQRVVAREPHADYVVVSPAATPHDRPDVFPIPDGVSYETAAYWTLTAGAATWVEIEAVQPKDAVVILGQGLVGSLILQVHKAAGHGPIVAVDALELRCDLASRLGADVVVDAAREDPVEAVRSITAGVGADVVVYAVGGAGGGTAFAQALDMLAVGGLLHLGRSLRAGALATAVQQDSRSAPARWVLRARQRCLDGTRGDRAARVRGDQYHGHDHPPIPRRASRRRLRPAARATRRCPRRDPGMGHSHGLSAAQPKPESS